MIQSSKRKLLFVFLKKLSSSNGLQSNIENIFGTGDGNSMMIYLSGFRHNLITSEATSSFLVGISDANSPFDMLYDSETILSGQVMRHSYD